MWMLVPHFRPRPLMLGFACILFAVSLPTSCYLQTATATQVEGGFIVMYEPTVRKSVCVFRPVCHILLHASGC